LYGEFSDEGLPAQTFIMAAASPAPDSLAIDDDAKVSVSEDDEVELPVPEEGRKPTAHELATLRRVSGPMPWPAYLICFSELGAFIYFLCVRYTSDAKILCSRARELLWVYGGVLGASYFVWMDDHGTDGLAQNFIQRPVCCEPSFVCAVTL
jgi:hypothetical protein